MPAIITDDLKRNLLVKLYESVVGDSDNYYLAIGRSEQWNDSDTTATPNSHDFDVRNMRLSMQSVKVAEDVTFTIPRNSWSSGSVYTQYDDKVSGNVGDPYYVITDENNVYVCIQRGQNTDGSGKASIVKPTGTLTSSFVASDGYIWKYLYSVPTPTAVKFLSSNYMPVKLVTSDSDINDALQLAVQDSAIPGQILGIAITSAGSGYTSAPTIAIEGDGDSAAATATILSGTIRRIQMSNRGKDYNFAKIKFSGGGGTGASARAIISPSGGLGADPRVTLKATALMFNSKPNGLENGTFIVGNDFRQLAIIKNPTDYAGVKYTGGTGLTLRKLILNTTGEASTFTINETITGQVSGTQAILDYVDSDTLYFHQTDTTGFGVFTSDISATITSPGGVGTLRAIIDSADVDYMSGEIIYLENRAPITRDEDQTEDIKIIIQL